MTNFNFFSSFFIFVDFIFQGTTADDGYYWKEYTGDIPPDALPGGKDSNDEDLFIGQAYFHNDGLYVVQICPGTMTVSAGWWGVKKATNDIKILCTQKPENFEWVPSTYTTFDEVLTKKNPVPGGYDFINNDGIMHIGRIRYQEFVKIGGIWSAKKDKSWLYFDYYNTLKKIGLYEGLVYNEK
ncbi:uncharacterized protein LOC123004000 [Tribolium madens]|uniref:uncharacterized protein LOC123004000 n=1 Tax=Tribolium madens TaxID=41895 RepID=UPI001CF73D6E|nr:uncharacterized protein LOC123004000 [Tribolium madens]